MEKVVTTKEAQGCYSTNYHLLLIKLYCMYTSHVILVPELSEHEAARKLARYRLATD